MEYHQNCLRKSLSKLVHHLKKECIVPSEWKEANITPLFKKGSRNKPENYRPVSLTYVVCKLLETLIRDHMVEFLVKHKFINTTGNWKSVLSGVPQESLLCPILQLTWYV